MPTRRDFLAAAAVCAAAPLAPAQTAPRFKKAVKYGMIGGKGTPAEKLALAKKCGFLGVEIDSPGAPPLDQLSAAVKSTGVVVHGVVDSVHWNATHALSHPLDENRAKGLAALRGALKDAKAVGADTVLLVPGVVRAETVEGKKVPVSYQECWDRSSAEVRKALPDAEAAGVKIAIEVVWNNFLTKPEQLVEYVDQFKSPWVGAYFDISNMLKYGVPAATWVRALGPRMLKFDFKGFSMTKFEAKQNPWVEIGEGTEDWADVLKALDEIGYRGWATAEVSGGDEKRLTDISRRMDKVLGL